MKEIVRTSPVKFKNTPAKQEKRDNWNVVLSYQGEKEGPWIVDLTHRTRFDLQDGNLAAKAPFGITVPESPGTTVVSGGFAASRMNRTQVSLWHLTGDVPALPDESAYTDVTESTVLLALMGEKVFDICEKLSALDFRDPKKKPPFLLQGPFSHVPCQIKTLCRDGINAGILLTCSKGYARDMVHAILDAGTEYGLTPAGEDRFTAWVAAKTGEAME